VQRPAALEHLRNLLITCYLVALTAFLIQPPNSSADDAAKQPTVILISIDGFRADYFDRGISPNLADLAAHGVRAQGMISSFPTLTFPNHYTLVTGRYPDHHGIVDNTMSDPSIQPDDHFGVSNPEALEDERWWDGATPLWISVQRQGDHSAAMFWPGSATPIHGARPDYWYPFDPNVTPDERSRQVLEWLDLPTARRPRLVTLYFEAVDTAGHRYGPGTAQVDTAIHQVDSAIGLLVLGLKERHRYDTTNIVVVSDHGMAPIPPGHEIYLDDYTDIEALRVVTSMEVAGLEPQEGVPATRVAEAVAKLLAPHPHMQCWNKQDIPSRFHYGTNARIPQIVCLAQTGWLILPSRNAVGPNGVPLGAHGYDNEDPLMRALFVAEGPSFSSGVVAPAFPNVDVYPLLAHILEVPPEPNDGDYARVCEMLKPAER
jgi:predicted AlkP superfamily pyrophosphatase or phosphodiesterase